MIYDRSITVNLEIKSIIDFYKSFFNIYRISRDDCLYNMAIFYIFNIISNEIDNKELSKLLMLSEEGEVFIIAPTIDNMQKMRRDEDKLYIIDFIYKLSSVRYKPPSRYPAFPTGIEYDLISEYRNKE